MWRPKEDWEEIVSDAIQRQYKDGMSVREIAELGADAMLEALKEAGDRRIRFEREDTLDTDPPDSSVKQIKGWLVFIPEEEK